MAALASSAVAVAQAPASTIARLPAPSAVRALHGTVLYAQPSATGSSKDLVLRGQRGQGPARVLATVKGLAGFDLGTDSRGRLVVVYSRCGAGASGCRLVMASPRFGSSSVIRNGHAAHARDVDPSIWGGRVVWVRRTASGPVVLSRVLSWPADRPSARLPGVPRHWRLASDQPRYRTTHRAVAGLDVGPRGLAEIVRFSDPDGGLCGLSQLRFVTLDPVRVSVVDQHTCGLSGQSMAGPSQTGTKVGWMLWCGGDPGFCQQRGGAYRFDLVTHATQRVALDRPQFPGFALDGQSFYAVESFLGTDPCAPDGATSGCPLIRRSGPWRPARRTTPHR